MFRRILVPLDGSKLAECALPYAEEIAHGCNTEEVVLVTVTEPIQGYRPFRDPGQPLEQRLVPEAVGKKEKQGLNYLGRIAKPLVAKGIKVQTRVLVGNPAEEIAFFSQHEKIDLIVMSTHGRSGPSRWAYGSVADKVFRASSVPVLMIRGPGCTAGI